MSRNPSALLFVALLLAAGPACATGQEMAGMAGAFILIFALMIGLPLGGLAVGILVVLAQRKGWWRNHPRRMQATCIAVMIAALLLAYLGILILVKVEDMRRNPINYTELMQQQRQMTVGKR